MSSNFPEPNSFVQSKVTVWKRALPIYYREHGDVTLSVEEDTAVEMGSVKSGD